MTLFAAAASGLRALPASCVGSQKAKLVAEMLFGRDIGNKLGVNESAWARFVAREITLRFPDGLTVTDALGQWRDPGTGKIVRERSKRVEIVLPGDDGDEARLEEIVSAYKRKFNQRSVGLIVRPACVSF